MKLLTLWLQNFLNHTDTYLEPGQLTVIAGLNNSGKSAIKDAIEMVLTGTARTTDKAGREAADVIQAGAGHFQLEVVVAAADHDGAGGGGESRPRLTISRSKSSAGDHVLDIVEEDGRTWEGSIPQKQKVLYDVLGANAGVIRACLHAGRLPEMKPDEQEALIFGTLGLDFTDVRICELLQECGATEDDVKWLFAGHDLSFLAKPKQETYGPEIFDETYKFAYEKRRQAKRDLGTAGDEFENASKRVSDLEREHPRLAQLDDEWLKRNRATLKELEDERDTLNQAKGRAEGLPVLVKRDEDRIRELEAEIVETADWKTEYDALMKGATNLDRQVEVAQDNVDTKVRSLEAAKLELETVEGAIKSFSGDTPTCPLAQTKCPMTKDAQKDLLKSLRAQRTKLKKALVSVEKDLEFFRAFAGQLRDLREHKPGSTVEQLDESLGNVREDLEQLRAQASEVDSEKLEELNGRIEKGRGLLRTVENYAAARKNLDVLRAKRDDNAAHVESWERLVKALGSGGAKLLAVEQPLQDLQVRINERLSQFASGYAVWIETENGFELKVRTPGTGDEWIPTKGLSTSERLRVGVALQDALAHLSGLRFLLIDNVDMLDAENRGRLGTALTRWSSDYDTVILLITAGKKLPVVDGRVTYWLENGSAELIS